MFHSSKDLARSVNGILIDSRRSLQVYFQIKKVKALGSILTSAAWPMDPTHRGWKIRLLFFPQVGRSSGLGKNDGQPYPHLGDLKI